MISGPSVSTKEKKIGIGKREKEEGKDTPGP